MIIGIHHTAISTLDIERALRFYRDELGFEEITRGSWEKGTEFADKVADLKDTAVDWIMLRTANCYVELFHFRSPRPEAGDPNRPVNKPGYTHICLEVTGLMAMYEQLKANGMRFHCEPEDHGDMGCIATYGRDPDGNVIELVEYNPGNIESLNSIVSEV
jgi:catechol 2,3-dioxygenase-like lactoylglutathione lyase family enzyme